MATTYSHGRGRSQEANDTKAPAEARRSSLTRAAASWQERFAVSNSVTRGIRIVVQSFYLAERSAPASGQYAFAYTVRIANEGGETAQLRARHWIITDGDGKVQEVRGEGVVGAQPTLGP